MTRRIDHFEYVAPLGRGAFAEVYEAQDVRQGHNRSINNNNNNNSNNNNNKQQQQNYAIKQLAKHCQSEIMIHSKLKHNNIVKLHKVVQSPDYNYLILELCHGGNLQQLLSKQTRRKMQKLETTTSGRHYTTQYTINGNSSSSSSSYNNNYSNNNNNNSLCTNSLIPVLDYQLIRRIMKQLCNALIYLHRNNIVHRDVNLNNLLILDRIPRDENGSLQYETDDINIKLADFGLAIDTNLRYNQPPSPSRHHTNNCHHHHHQQHHNHHHHTNRVGTTYNSATMWKQQQEQLFENHPSKFATSTPRRLPHQSHVNFMPVGDTICGTPGFIAPEIINGQQCASPSMDAYSVGSVLYAMVTGSVPKRKQLQLSQVPTLLVDLITSLLQEDPADRLSLEDVLKHPFIIGPIVANRLPFITKQTNTMEIVVSPDCPMIKSLTTPTRIQTNADGSQVIVADKLGRTNKYSLETLPKVHWQKYHHLSAFVDLVKAKVVKLYFYCNQICSNGLIIEKCCLMENKSLEITISNPNHVLKKSSILLFDEMETSFDNQYVAAHELKAVCAQCRQLERGLEKQAMQCPGLLQSLFPAKFGQKANKTRSFCSSIDSKRDSKQQWNTSIDCGDLSTSSRSITISHPDVEYARQSDGYLEVSFIDGATLKFYTHTPEILYSNSKGLQCSYIVDLRKLPCLDKLDIPNELRSRLKLISLHIQDPQED